jgi:uncharacterized protein (TIGR02118 family)
MARQRATIQGNPRREGVEAVMVKVMFTWRNKPGMSEEETDRYYREVHTPIAVEAFGRTPGFRAYVQNKVLRYGVQDYADTKTRPASAPFDRFIEVYFKDMEHMRRAFRSPTMRKPVADHPNFMKLDTPASIGVFELEEYIALSRDPDA